VKYLVICGFLWRARDCPGASARPNIQSICLPVQQLQCLHHVSCTPPTEGWGRLPIQRFWYKGCPSGWLASPLRPRSGSSSLCPRAAATLAGTPVADAMVNGWKLRSVLCAGDVRRAEACLNRLGAIEGNRTRLSACVCACA
jgi:hypothetical protein